MFNPRITRLVCIPYPYPRQPANLMTVHVKLNVSTSFAVCGYVARRLASLLVGWLGDGVREYCTGDFVVCMSLLSTSIPLSLQHTQFMCMCVCMCH